LLYYLRNQYQEDFMEVEFVLPRGYADNDGHNHTQGSMRLATALDEIEPLQDPRVRGNEAYLVILLLARVVTRLGEIPAITPQVIEGLYASDLAYLQDVYQRLNAPESVVVGAVCPNCSTQFQLQVAPLS
jgi:hypothetical protein